MEKDEYILKKDVDSPLAEDSDEGIIWNTLNYNTPLPSGLRTTQKKDFFSNPNYNFPKLYLGYKEGFLENLYFKEKESDSLSPVLNLITHL